MKKLYYSLLLGSFLLNSGVVMAQVMTSTNFQIASDAVAAGGALSTSTNFGVFDVLNTGAAATTSTSSNFNAAAGFLAVQPDDRLTVTFSKNTISLGTLSVNSIATDSQTLTVTTNSASGYTATIQADGGLRSGSNTIRGASGSITAGAEGYGVLTSGGNGQLSSITTISTSPQTIVRSTVPVTAVVTTITYQATISGSTGAGDYSQTVTFTTTANF